MAGYKPLYVRGPQTGLVQERQEFILPDDAYPILENAFVWREQIKRKQGLRLLARLQRSVEVAGLNTTNFISGLSLESTSSIVLGSISIVDNSGNTWTDPSKNGTLVSGILSGTINYSTGAFTGPTLPLASGTIQYYPNLPVMGLRLQELNGIDNENTLAFDQKYCYTFSGTTWQEFIPGTTWTGSNSNFFWSTNYWVTPAPANLKLFWVTNDVDPIRYTNGTSWISFTPVINAAGDVINQCLCILPFRGRLMVFNTVENGVSYSNRIRWAAIGNPISTTSALFPIGTINPNAWRDDIRGQGGYLDIPTSEQIITVGFVRDNLVIYCERSTWQLRYTGRSIAPFQIEKVNSELGAKSTFSAVQFDTSLVGVGDKGVVECDSYKSERIDIKIPDLVFEMDDANEGVSRIHGIRDLQQRLVYWTYPYFPVSGTTGVFPNRRLVYNYENDSWAIFTDSLTTLGTFQAQNPLTWNSFSEIADDNTWENQNYPWVTTPALFPSIIGGNQQGFVEYLGSNLEPQVVNDVSLYISNITGNTNKPTVLTSPNHNLQTGQIIKITNIPAGTGFDNLNDQIFYVIIGDNTGSNLDSEFQLWKYNNQTQEFTDPQLDVPDTYIGGGLIAIRDNFNITSKKFNMVEQGQSIQLGYLDLLTNSTSNGAFSLFVYLNYNNSTPSNIYPENNVNSTQEPDTFFNSVINTYQESAFSNVVGSKYWQRVFCPTRGNFITLQYTFSNAQMIGQEQENDVQIDAQVIWARPAGRLTNF